MVTLKYLSDFWRKLELSLSNCKISLQLKQSKDCFLLAVTAANQAMEIKIIYTKLFVPFVTLLAQDMINLLKQLDSDFKRTINQNKYQSKKKTNQAQNRKLDLLIIRVYQE